MRIACSGPPGSGKSSILDRLSLDYELSPDYSREIIDRENIHPLDDHLAFQKRWLDRMVRAYNEHRHNTLFQYGFPDIIVYFKWRGGATFTIPREFINAVSAYRYDAVLLVDPLPEEYYTRDHARTMTYAQSLEINELTSYEYAALGYTPISIPYAPLEQRVQLVQHFLRSTST